MKDLSEVKEALISIEDGTVKIVIGQINRGNKNYHDRVSFFEVSESYIFVKGHQLDRNEVWGVIYDNHPKFKQYCEQLIGFSERIETKRKFSWKKFKFEERKCVVNSEWGSSYIFKPELWEPKEYKANNWTITEI